MSRRYICYALVLSLLLTLGLVACGDSTPTTSSSTTAAGSATTAAGGTTTTAASGAATTAAQGQGLTGTLDYWIQADTQSTAKTAWDKIINDFQTANPGAKVNIVFIPKNDYNTKLSTAIASGTPPDAAYLDAGLVPSFVSDDQLATVPDGLVNPADYSPGAFNTGVVNGKTYGLPLDQTCIALFYNKDLIPTPPKTWDEMLDMAKKVYNPEKQIAAVGVPKGDGFGAWMFPAFVASAGGKMLDPQTKTVSFAEQPGIDALAFWKQLLAYSPRAITDSQNAFETGHVAFGFSGPWSLDSFKSFPDLHYGVALIPAKAGQKSASNIGGFSTVVFKKGKNQALAWAWNKYLATGDVNLNVAWNIIGDFPATLKGLSADVIQKDPNLQVFVEQLKTAQPRPTVNAWVKINDEVVAKAIDAALDGGADPKATMQDAAAKARQILGW